MKRTPLRADPEKTRAWQARSRKGFKQVSDKRRKANAERRAAVVVDGPRVPVVPDDHSFREFVLRLVCCVDRAHSTQRVDPAHHRTKRVAHDWIDVDGRLVGNLMPLHRLRHIEQHSMPIADFEAHHDINVAKVCEVVGEAYQSGWSAYSLSIAAIEARGYQHLDLDNPQRQIDMEAP